MDEDISFMPLQQACIERFGQFRPIPINADATLIEARKVVQRLLRAEQGAAAKLSAVGHVRVRMERAANSA